MAGNYVFPGGVVEPQDRKPDIPVDLSPEEIEKRLGDGLSAEDARVFGVTAIRETFEEAGVLLAAKAGSGKEDPAGFNIPQDQDSPGVEKFYRAVRQGGWRLGTGSLYRWSHWITPLGMVKRFDTRFFLAAMPDHQSCHPDNFETIHGLWTTPEDGLQGNLDGTIPLSPPTVVTLHQLLAFTDFAALMAHVRTRPWGETIRPRMVRLEKGAMIIEPWDPEYLAETIDIDTETLEARIAPVGAPFSRIWFNGGLWRPVGSP